MTIMNGRIRQDLTDLLADHLNEQHAKRILADQGYPMPAGLFQDIAEDAMDFIYGSEDDGNPPKPPQSSEAHAWVSDQGDVVGVACRCGSGDCGWPGDLPGVEDVLTGVMPKPENPLRASFVYLGPLSRIEGYVPVPTSSFEPTPRSSPGSDSTDD